MKLIACFLMALSLPLTGQTKPVPGALDAEVQHDQSLHLRAQSVVEAERLRAKQPICPKAVNTLSINTCYAAEVAATDANYLKLVRALGALLRAGGESTPKTPAPIPFDDAETAWHGYVDLACKAAGDQYEGGTIRPSIEMGCRLTITRHHMDELWSLYNDLGTR